MISVITPTFRRSEYLQKAIESVLAQTYADFELLVVDDNGADSPYHEQTAKVMEPFVDESRVRYLPLPKNLGGAGARNAGIAAASGEFITFLDDDDVYLPEKLEKQLDFMLKSGVDVSVMDGATYNDNEKLLSRKIQKLQNGMAPEELMRVHLMYHISGTNTFMFRAAALRKIGGFPSVPACQEYMLMLKALDAELTVGYLPETLIKNYIRPGGRLSSGEKKYYAEKMMFQAKKKRFFVLSFKQRRYVRCRHFGVLFYVQLKRKKMISAVGYLLLSLLCSPETAFCIFKDYKGKLFAR